MCFIIDLLVIFLSTNVELKNKINRLDHLLIISPQRPPSPPYSNTKSHLEGTKTGNIEGGETEGLSLDWIHYFAKNETNQYYSSKIFVFFQLQMTR